MKFIGVITFLESAEKENDSRETAVMPFDVAADWFQSVTEFHKQAVMVGDYDGTEVLINVFQYNGSVDFYGRPDHPEFDSDMLIHSVSIPNPYYV